MLFKDALEIHRAHPADHSHSEIFGDGYLMQENQIYRKIRLRALDLGAQLKEATLEYLLLPLNQLDKIIAKKQIPYIPSARLMADVETTQPGVFDFQQMPIPGSYQLHEAAHFIADHCLLEAVTTTQDEKILKSILSEAFANTVDALACAEADSETHKIILRMNCYLAPNESIRRAVEIVRAQLGDRFVARLLLLSYVDSNFLRDEAQVLFADEAMPPQNVIEACRSLSRLGQELDPLFRTQTASNYFHLQGFRGEIFDMLDFDFRQLMKREDFGRAVEALISVIC